ncbi:MAG: ribosome maturation factor [Sulfuricurvum sp.]
MQDIELMANSIGLELYDVSTLRDNDELIYRVSVVSTSVVDGKREAVSMDKCVDLTHLLSPLLDVKPPVSGEYRLEVGSAGVERKITSLRQAELSVGESVQLSLRDKTKLRGELVDVKDEILTISVDGKTQEVGFGDVKSARTYFEW